MVKLQIIFIHGGSTFATQEDYILYLKNKSVSLDDYTSWTQDYFDNHLNEYFQIVKPRFPLKENAVYSDWKLLFEKYVELIDDNAILIGYSLGGIFLSRYLSENTFPKKLLSVYLIAPPFDDDFDNMNLVGGFKLKKDISLILKNCSRTVIMGSKTDNEVPFRHFEKYKKALPGANFCEYEDKGGHFFVEEFPELIQMIKADLKIIEKP